MNRKTCYLNECDRPSLARGLCESHYARWRREGEEFDRSPIRPSSVEARFFAKVQKSPAPGCWLWTGTKNQFGYGQLSVNRVMVAVHRFSYGLTGAEMPDGYELDHTCGVRVCVNPAHLRLATRKQNAENAIRLRSTNKSGVHGVSWDKEARKWRTQVCHNGRKYCVGRFANLADAEAAAIAKRNELFTHNDRDREREAS